MCAALALALSRAGGFASALGRSATREKSRSRCMLAPMDFSESDTVKTLRSVVRAFLTKELFPLEVESL